MERQLHESVPYSPETSSYLYEANDRSNFVPSHWHRGLELIYIKGGNLSVNIGGVNYLLHPEEFIVVSPKFVHSTSCLDTCNDLVLQISYDFLKTYIPDIESIRFGTAALPASALPASDCENTPFSPASGTKDPAVSDLMRQLFELRQHPSPHSGLLFHQLLFELLYHLVQHYSFSSNPFFLQKTSKELDRLVPILDYIQENYSRPLTLKSIAGYACLNPEYFCRYFKKYVGSSLTDYIDSVRLQHVARDLVYTDLPICRLLEKHGFRNPRHFRQLFQKTFRSAPSAFRGTQSAASQNNTGEQ